MFGNRVTTTLGLCLAACPSVFAPASGIAAQPPGVVAGVVFDADTRPVRAQVSIEGTALLTVTNSRGEFRMGGVPSGPVALRVSALGYNAVDREVEVQPADSVFESITLTRSLVRIPGAGYFFPDLEHSAIAERLLADVMSAVAAEGPQFMERMVWAPWISRDRTTEAGYRIVRECASCVAQTLQTVEGGAQYEVNEPHLRLGVTTDAPGQDLLFCLDPAERGDVLMANCYGSGQTISIRYDRAADGRWLRIR